jgi:hypothetical protein
MPKTNSSYKTDSEILKKLFELAKEKYKGHVFSSGDWAIDHDNMIDELSWYEDHFEQIAEFLIMLEKFYPQNPSRRKDEDK